MLLIMSFSKTDWQIFRAWLAKKLKINLFLVLEGIQLAKVIVKFEIIRSKSLNYFKIFDFGNILTRV